jgi:hypothetical protein
MKNFRAIRRFVTCPDSMSEKSTLVGSWQLATQRSPVGMNIDASGA